MPRGYRNKWSVATASRPGAESSAGEGSASGLRHLVTCVSLVALGTAAISYRVLHGTGKEPAPAHASVARTAPAEDPSEPLAALERRLAALESRPAQIDSRPPGATTSAPSVASSAAPPPSRKPPPTREQLDSYAQTEGRDRPWADAYERDLRASFATAFKDDRVREVSCGTSMCKVVVDHPSRAAAGAFGRGYWAALPDGYAAAHLQPSTDESGDGASSVIHVIRQGYAEAVFGAGREL